MPLPVAKLQDILTSETTARPNQANTQSFFYGMEVTRQQKSIRLLTREVLHLLKVLQTAYTVMKELIINELTNITYNRIKRIGDLHYR